MKAMVSTLLALLVVGVPGLAAAADDAESAAPEVSIEQLLDLEIGVASKKGSTVREAPGVVTLITRDDIRASGARDLMDVLWLVPGFDFGVDVGGVAGIGFRGVWGQEGKVLLLLDGFEMNETLYSTLQFGSHYPVAGIEKIEIIRGPGSAIYGGYAELAVINIVTRTGKELAGGDVRATYGQTAGNYARRGVGFDYGREIESIGLDFNLTGEITQANRSDRDFRDFSGGRYSMRNDSAIDAILVHAGLNWKGLGLRLLYDDYRLWERDGYGATSYPQAFRNDFITLATELRYDLKIGQALTVTPRVSYKNQTPYRTTDKDPAGPFYDKTAARSTAGLTVSWDALETVNLLAGVEGTRDDAKLNDPAIVGLQSEFATGNSVTYQNLAAFGQVLCEAPFANLAVGARYENHSHFGESFVPRAALTKVIDRVNLKLLWADAFRAPSIENITVNPDIQPERTTVYEAEAGYRFTDNLFASVNVFDLTISHPIVYDVSDTGEEAYFNFSRTGSRGAELDVRYRDWQRHAALTTSYYSAAGKNEVPLNAVDGDPGQLLAMPRLKITALAGVDVRDGVTVDGSLVLLGPRVGYLSGNGDGTAPQEEADPVLLLNLVLSLRDLPVKNLDVSLGIYNVLDRDYALIQPYDGSHAPLPMNSREIMTRVGYSF